MSTKVLVVDDEKELLELLEERFKDCPEIEACFAASGKEFRQRVREVRPDIIILDIMLGDSNGVEVYEELCADCLDDSIPVIFLSALNEGHPDENAKPGRKYSLHTKPFDFHDLLRDIHCLT